MTSPSQRACNEGKTASEKPVHCFKPSRNMSKEMKPMRQTSAQLLLLLCVAQRYRLWHADACSTHVFWIPGGATTSAQPTNPQITPTNPNQNTPTHKTIRYVRCSPSTHEQTWFNQPEPNQAKHTHQPSHNNHPTSQPTDQPTHTLSIVARAGNTLSNHERF